MRISMTTLFLISFLLTTVYSATWDNVKDDQSVKSWKNRKEDALSPIIWPGRNLKPPSLLGKPEPPPHPKLDESPINLLLNEASTSPNSNAVKNQGNKSSNDLKTANSLGYYSYWGWPNYCSYYWPSCYGYGYRYRYLPYYTSFWGKWNRYYAYPYYNHYDNFYDDFWYRR